MEEDEEEDEEEEEEEEEEVAAQSRVGRKRAVPQRLRDDAPSKEESKRQKQQEREEDALAAATKIIRERQTTAKSKGWKLCKALRSRQPTTLRLLEETRVEKRYKPLE